MNIQLKKLNLLIQHFVILQLRHTTFITQSLKEIHSGRETGLIDTGPLRSVSNKHFLIPKPKINLFKNSLSYSGALVWNSIPLDLKKIL